MRKRDGVIEGKEVKLEINANPREESEVEKMNKELMAEKRTSKLEKRMAWLMEKFASEIPEDLK